MRRYFAWAILAGAMLSSCQMYDNLPNGDNKPGLYITKEITELKELLAGSEYGWQMVLLPGSYQYGGINFCFKFDAEQNVTTYSEDDMTPSQSTYRLYQSAGIRMTFDTRNPQLGRYSEPRNTLLRGLEGDFEFVVDRVSEDKNTIELKGIYSRNRMLLVRMTESPEDYLKKVTEVRQALYGKALPKTTIGGQQVAMSIFGLIRQLQVKVGDAKERILPIYFTPEGIRIIDPEGLIDEQDASQGKIGQVGTELLRELKVEKAGDTYHVLSPSGEKLEIQSANFDLTQNKIRMLFFPGWCGSGFDDIFVKTNGAKYTSGDKAGQDSIPAEMANDPYYNSADYLGEVAFLGKTDGGDHKLSLSLTSPNGDDWLSYYLDFAPVSDEPNQIYIRRFVQDGYSWRYRRYAMQGVTNALVDNSPYRIYWNASTEHAGQYEFVMASLTNNSFWMRISNYYEPSHSLDDMKVYNGKSVY